jgi:lysine-specific histone demethylase 1
LTDDEPSSDSDSDTEPDLPSGLEGAAFASRMPASRMTQQEVEFFPDIVHGSQPAMMEFLLIRNRLLQAWLADPTAQLTTERAQGLVQLPQSGKSNLVLRIHGYLQRYGFINYGVFSRQNPMHGKMPFKVVVVGGGVSGLMAARQLTYFGLDVSILEARDRIGGRIHTFKSGQYVADLGAMVITGLGGNPLSVLKRQLGLHMSKIHRRCPLYFTTGEMVLKERDKTVELEFNRLLDSVSHLSHQLQVNQLGGKPLSLGQALELVIVLQEKHTREKLRDHLQAIASLQAELLEVRKRLGSMQNKIRATHDRKQKLLKASSR